MHGHDESAILRLFSCVSMPEEYDYFSRSARSCALSARESRMSPPFSTTVEVMFFALSANSPAFSFTFATRGSPSAFSFICSLAARALSRTACPTAFACSTTATLAASADTFVGLISEYDIVIRRDVEIAS